MAADLDGAASEADWEYEFERTHSAHWARKVQALCIDFVVSRNVSAPAALRAPDWPLGKLVPLRTVQRWVSSYRAHGGVLPIDTREESAKRRGQEIPRNGRDWEAPELEAIRDVLQRHPDATLSEIADELVVRGFPERPLSTLFRVVSKRLQLTLKKSQHVALERNEEDRREYLRQISKVPRAEQFMFIDETQRGKDSLKRSYARAFIGKRAQICSDLHSNEPRYTFIGAADVNGFVLGAGLQVFKKRGRNDHDPLRGNIDQLYFNEYVRQYVVPVVGNFAAGQPRSLVVMDNATVHKSPIVRELIEGAGARLLYTAPYSPDLNPIEYFFSVYKTKLRAIPELARTDPREAHFMAQGAVTRDHAIHTFRHCYIRGTPMTSAECAAQVRRKELEDIIVVWILNNNN